MLLFTFLGVESHESKTMSKEKINIRKKLNNLFSRLKKEASNNNQIIDYTKLASFSIKEGRLNRQEIKRAIFYLRSTGCEWSLKKNGGCLNCGHYAGTSMGKKISSEYFFQQFKDKVDTLDVKNLPMFCIYNAGSFLNKNELPIPAREKILDYVANHPHIRALIIESRPEYITQDIIDYLESTFRNKRVEIGVGLELADDYLRSICVNKGFSLQEYIGCAQLFKRSRINLLTYVLIKPLFLTINEALEETVKTVFEAYNNGANVVSLEPISIQNGTLTEFFHSTGNYTLPTAWDIIEVLKLVDHLPIEIRIGGFEYYPEPIKVVTDCPNCQIGLCAAIKEYNSSRNIQPLLSLQCSCKEDWERRIQLETQLNHDLNNRVATLLTSHSLQLTEEGI